MKTITIANHKAGCAKTTTAPRSCIRSDAALKRLGQVTPRLCKPKRSPARGVARGTSSGMAQPDAAHNATAAIVVVANSSPATTTAAMTRPCGNSSCRWH
jgi:hypothetical protein